MLKEKKKNTKKPTPCESCAYFDVIDEDGALGCTIDIDEDNATISYRVVFYDEEGEYLSTTEALETDYDETTTPETAESFRVVITPDQVDGEDVEISIFTMSKYANQLDVAYNK